MPGAGRDLPGGVEGGGCCREAAESKAGGHAGGDAQMVRPPCRPEVEVGDHEVAEGEGRRGWRRRRRTSKTTVGKWSGIKFLRLLLKPWCRRRRDPSLTFGSRNLEAWNVESGNCRCCTAFQEGTFFFHYYFIVLTAGKAAGWEFFPPFSPPSNSSPYSSHSPTLKTGTRREDRRRRHGRRSKQQKVL